MQMIQFDFDLFKSEGEKFLTSLVQELSHSGLGTESSQCDHLCFRVGTIVEYEAYKTHLNIHGQLLTEAMVNGRPICTYRLKTPFKTQSHEVPLVELPSPKPGVSYSTGFEHAEFVIQECFSTFKAKYPKLRFSEGGNPILNPELRIELKGQKQAKFHHLTLDRVIQLEEAKIKHIIFDFDGTLIKSRETIYEINRVIFSKALNRDITLQESIEKFHPEFSKLFEAYNVTCPLKQAEALENWGHVSNEFTYELFEGAIAALELLKNHGYILHLWTARDEMSSRSILQKHGIEHFFTTLSFASVTDSKPHAKSLMFHWQQCQPDEMIVIGDSPTDILGARNIQAIRAAALWDPYAKRTALIEHGAELLFEDLAKVSDWLTS